MKCLFVNLRATRICVREYIWMKIWNGFMFLVYQSTTVYTDWVNVWKCSHLAISAKHSRAHPQNMYPELEKREIKRKRRTRIAVKNWKVNKNHSGRIQWELGMSVIKKIHFRCEIVSSLFEFTDNIYIIWKSCQIRH